MRTFPAAKKRKKHKGGAPVLRSVLLDADLARLYGVETRALNPAVKRNPDRFPEEFAFTLTRDEILGISQTVTPLHH